MEVQTILGARVKIDSLEKALVVLDGIGCVDNGAHLIRREDNLYSHLVYEAMICDPRPEYGIKRPKSPQGLQQFLYELFNPFLYSDHLVHSVIDLHQFTRAELKEWRRREGIRDSYLEVIFPQKIFRLIMLLYLKSELTEEAINTLTKYSDMTKQVTGIEFILD